MYSTETKRNARNLQAMTIYLHICIAKVSTGFHPYAVGKKSDKSRTTFPGRERVLVFALQLVSNTAQCCTDFQTQRECWSLYSMSTPNKDTRDMIPSSSAKYIKGVHHTATFYREQKKKLEKHASNSSMWMSRRSNHRHAQ